MGFEKQIVQWQRLGENSSPSNTFQNGDQRDAEESTGLDHERAEKPSNPGKVTLAAQTQRTSWACEPGHKEQR